MRSRHVPGFLLLFTIGVLPGFGQMRSTSRGTYNIDGYVRDDRTQQGMEDVRVDLKDGTGIPINSTFTRENGIFQFTGLNNGDYILQVNLQDYEPLQQSVTISYASTRGVTLFLARGVRTTNSKSGTMISAHQLNVPHKAHDEYDKGIALLYGKSDYQGAIVQFQRAIKDYPTYYEAYAQEGGAYLNLGEIAAAEEALRKSLDLSSGQYPDALFMLSGLLTDAKRYSDAVPFARKAIEVNASSWRGPYELARALSGLKELDEAEKSAIQARDMKPDNPPVYLILANIHILLHSYPALIEDLGSYLKLVPTGPIAEQAKKTLDELQAHIQQIQSQAPDDTQAADRADGQNPPNVAPAPAPPPEPEPDTSGLPSLPSPAASNQ